jgi:hypothetical protein
MHALQSGSASQRYSTASMIAIQQRPSNGLTM